MRTIVCKKCGATIDATLGECPNCGAVYYILPDDDKKLEWAMNPDSDIDATHVFGSGDKPGTRSGSAHSARDIVNADNDELFNTSVWKVNKDPDETRMFRSQPTAGSSRPAVTPTQRPAAARPAAQRPVAQNSGVNSSRGSGNGMKPPDNEKDIRKKWLIVSAIALLAVLTLVLSIMGGVFNFGGNESNKTSMPNVLGFTQETANTVLTGMNLKVKTKTADSDKAEGIVIDQSIKENAKVSAGDTVTITISSGPKTTATTEEYIDVPSLTGETYDAARTDLNNMGLEIRKNDDVYDNSEVGQIVTQSPMKGAKLQKGSLVTVTLSKGPQPSPSPSAHFITVSTGNGGSISPKGTITVEDGANKIFTITPDPGYKISEVNVDGTDVGAVSSYPFTKVTGDHTIFAVFEKDTSTSPTPAPSETPNTEPPATSTKP